MAFSTSTVGNLAIASATLAGTETSYTFPDTLRSVTFAQTGDMTLALATSGTPTYTLNAGAKESIDGKCLSGRTVYFNGTGVQTLLLILGTNT